MSYPILEFDEDRSSITMPDPFALDFASRVPSRGVLCFFQDVINELVSLNQLTVIGYLRSEIGKHPVYQYTHNSEPVTVFHPGIGAPLAAAFLERLISIGVTKYIVCGGCGVLDRKIDPGTPVILTAAIRDEGTSYHYLPPSREVKPHPAAVRAIESACQELDVPYRKGTSWTTDAFYRETPGKRKLRMEEGCEVVEMEAAAFFAVAQFREIKLGQIVYGGDLVHPDGWDSRAWVGRSDSRRLLFDLAVNAVQRL